MNFAQTVVTRSSHWINEWLRSVTATDLDQLPQWDEIEFIGGPLDGHTEALQAEQVHHLPPAIEVDTTLAPSALLNDRGLVRHPPARGAMYDLVQIGSRWVYKFSAPIPPSLANGQQERLG